MIADTVLSIAFNILTSRKPKKLCRDIARTCCISRASSMGLLTRVVQLAGLRVEQCCACSYLNGAASQEVATTYFVSLPFDTSILSLASAKGLGGSQKLMRVSPAMTCM